MRETPGEIVDGVGSPLEGRVSVRLRDSRLFSCGRANAAAFAVKKVKAAGKARSRSILAWRLSCRRWGKLLYNKKRFMKDDRPGWIVNSKNRRQDLSKDRNTRFRALGGTDVYERKLSGGKERIN